MVLSATSSTVSRFSARIRCLRLNRPDHFSRRSASSLLVETVSDPVERIDRVERWVDDTNIVAIGDVEQLVAGFYASGPLRERFEDQELGNGEADDSFVPEHSV